jgi:hypothetical protein
MGEDPLCLMRLQEKLVLSMFVANAKTVAAKV